MKRFVTIILLIIISTASWGQKSIYLEGFGASNTIGVNYDARFSNAGNLGYRIGLGYSCGSDASSGFFWDIGQKVQGVSIPIGINWLCGHKNHFFEVGVGMNNGVYHAVADFENVIGIVDGSIVVKPRVYESGTRWGHYFFGDIGYRYQPVKGIMVRAGINPSFSFGEKNRVTKYLLYPYISVGWSF